MPSVTDNQSASGFSEVHLDFVQLADQPRVPWNWFTTGKTDEPYEPGAVEKWWYDWAQGFNGSDAVASSVGRITKTTLRKQLFNKDLYKPISRRPS